MAEIVLTGTVVRFPGDTGITYTIIEIEDKGYSYLMPDLHAVSPKIVESHIVLEKILAGKLVLTAPTKAEFEELGKRHDKWETGEDGGDE